MPSYSSSSSEADFSEGGTVSSSRTPSRTVPPSPMSVRSKRTTASDPPIETGPSIPLSEEQKETIVDDDFDKTGGQTSIVVGEQKTTENETKTPKPVVNPVPVTKKNDKTNEEKEKKKEKLRKKKKETKEKRHREPSPPKRKERDHLKKGTEKKKPATKHKTDKRKTDPEGLYSDDLPPRGRSPTPKRGQTNKENRQTEARNDPKHDKHKADHKTTKAKKRDDPPRKKRKTTKKRPRAPSPSSASQISVDISESSESESERALRRLTLARDLRKSAQGRDRFDDFHRADFDQAAQIFFDFGYYRLETVKRMQEHARTYFISNLKKQKGCTATSARLALDLVETFQTKMKNAKDPRIEEVQIPREMTKWNPSLASLTGILVPDQDMVNHFTIELTRGRNEVPAYTPFVTGDLSADPWIPGDPLYTRAHDQWKKMQTTHKRPSDQPMSFQLFVLTYLRFALAGDLAGARTPFGGLAAQLTHLGTLLSISATENALTAMTYDKTIRMTIATQSRKRISDEQAIKLTQLLTEEHDATKRATLRDINAAASDRQVDPPNNFVNRKNDPSRRNGVKGKGKKKGKGGKRTNFTRNDQPEKGKGKRKGKHQTWSHQGPQWEGKGQNGLETNDNRPVENDTTRTTTNAVKGA